MENGILSDIKSFSIPYRENVALSQFTFMKTGGILKLLLLPESKAQIQKAVSILKKYEQKFKVIGATSNCLFLDDSKLDVLVKLSALTTISMSNDRSMIIVDGGCAISKLSQFAIKNNIKGFEGLIGIPGTIGGAIYSNAGSYGNEISDTLLNIEVVSLDGLTKIYKKEELDFSFRHSRFKNENFGVIVCAVFKNNPGDKNKLRERLKYAIYHRKNYQEHSLPNLGSTFATIDLYGELARYHLPYKILLYVFRKVIRIVRPKNNIVLNMFTCWYFKIDYKTRVFSDKTMNCIVNKNATTKRMLEYIDTIAKLTKGSVKLEIEIL